MTTPALPDRRHFLAYFSSIGLGSTLLPGVLWAKVSAGAEITKETIAAAETALEALAERQDAIASQRTAGNLHYGPGYCPSILLMKIKSCM